MKTTSLLGATIVDEAKAVAIINYCLFGERPAHTKQSVTPLRKKKRVTTRTTPVTQPRPTKCPLDDVVLRKHTPPPTNKQVTNKRITETRPLWQPRQGLSFPRGLCYLLAVQEHNWPSATVELGYYPTVTDLMNSPLVEKFSTYVVEQLLGLYHMKGYHL